jgi:hypothetical protein
VWERVLGPKSFLGYSKGGYLTKYKKYVNIERVLFFDEGRGSHV